MKILNNPIVILTIRTNAYIHEPYQQPPTDEGKRTTLPEGNMSSCDCFSRLLSLADNGRSFDDDISLLLELLTDPVTTLLRFSASLCVNVSSTFPTVGREGKSRGGASWNLIN